MRDFIQSRNHRQHGTLAATRVTDDADDLAFFDSQFKTVHHPNGFAVRIGIGFHQVENFNVSIVVFHVFLNVVVGGVWPAAV